MARGMDLRKLRLEECTAPSSLCLCQYPPEVSHCSRNRISVSSGKGLNFITNYVFLVTKYNGNYNWQNFHTIRKVQMQSCGKTRSMSISQARETNLNNKELTIFCLQHVSGKKMSNYHLRCENKLLNQYPLKLNSLVSSSGVCL